MYHLLKSGFVQYTFHNHWCTTHLWHFGKWPSRTKCIVEIGYYITVMCVYLHGTLNLVLTWHLLMGCIVWLYDLSHSRHLLAPAMVYTAVRQSSITEMYKPIPAAKCLSHTMPTTIGKKHNWELFHRNNSLWMWGDMWVLTSSLGFSVLFWYVIDRDWHESKSIVVNRNWSYLLVIRKSCCPKFHSTSNEAVHSCDDISFMCEMIHTITPKSW